MNDIQGFELSLQQKRVWSLQQQSQVYIAQCAVTMEGDLNSARLQNVWRKMVACHDILRTHYHRIAGMKFPVQVVAEQPEFHWENIDLSAMGKGDQALALAEIYSNISDSIDWTSEIPLHLILIKLSSNQQRLLIRLPALCADGQTLQILFEEMCRRYKDDGAILNEDLISYIQFSGWQNSLAEDEDNRTGLTYWLERKEQFGSLTLLPQEESSFDQGSFHPAWLTQKIPEQIMIQAETLAREWDVPVSVLLMAGWRALLWQFTKSPEILTGFVSDGRYYEELATAVGLFAKWCPALISFSGIQSLRELVSNVAEYLDDIAEWEEYFYWDFIMSDGDNAYAGLGFEYETWPQPQMVEGVLFTFDRQQICVDRFRLKLEVACRNSVWYAQWLYDAQLFSGKTIQLIASQFESLMVAVVHNPYQPIYDLEATSPLDQEVLDAINATESEYDRQTTIHRLFSKQVSRTPDVLALQTEAGEITYAQLHSRSNQLAHYLHTLDVGPETPVAILLPRSLNLIVGLLGILKAGGAYVPIDASYPPERIKYILSDLQNAILITCRESIEQHELTEQHCRLLISLNDDWPLIAQQAETELNIQLSSQNLAYIIYTSGSTGKPKGTLITHQGVVNYLSWCIEAYNITRDANTLLHTSVGFDLTVTSLFAPLLAGQTVTLLPESDDITALTAAIQTTPDLGLIKITPSHLDVLNKLMPSSAVATPIATLVIGGEALSKDQLHYWQTYAPQTRLINEYGPTETVVGSSFYEIRPKATTRDEIPIGRPIANTQIYLLDDRLHQVPIGVPGELYIGGDGLARGYLNRPGLTAEKFIPNPFSLQPGTRLYRTGDIACYLPDGNLQFLGRVDYQVKIRGFRIETREIEYVLNQHPGVQQSCLVARESEGDGKRLVAYIVVAADNELTPGHLRQFLQTQLPDFMIPSAYVKLGELPLNANGKIDRQALPPPTHDWLDLTRSFVPSNNDTEALLIQLWSDILRVNRISIHDNFFELGGDSILGLRVISRAREAGIHLLPKQIFEHQTIAELATVATTVASLVIEQIPITGNVPFVPIQQWFFEQQFHHPYHWNQSLLFRVRDNLDPISLEIAVRTVLTHHDALRMRFKHGESGWQQRNAGPDDQIPFTYIDLTTVSASQHTATIEAICDRVQTSLNLEQGPLSRFVFFNLGSGISGRLLIVVHHLVIDTVSWQILLEDLSTIFQQLNNNIEINLPLKTTSFQEWANRLQQYATSEALLEERAYWLENRSLPVKSLPLDFPENRDNNTLASSCSLLVSLNESDTDSLQHTVPKSYRASIHEILLAALLITLTEWANEKQILIHLEGHGREPLFEDVDVSRTVGWFTALYPILLDIDAETSPEAILKIVKEQLRRVPYSGINYGILRYLAPNNEVFKTLSQPEVIFNYLGQFDHVDSKDSMFAIAMESTGEESSRQGNQTYLLTINAHIVQKQLHISWGYSKNLFHSTTIKSLAHNYLEYISWFIVNNQEPAASAYVASDFPKAKLSQSELEKFLSDLGGD